MADHECDQILDITGEICPMTYVRTRLALDRLAPGQVLAVRLKGAGPEHNVPRNAAQQGHIVLATECDAAGVTVVYLRRG
jgi:TusA-related sulfurtransferase